MAERGGDERLAMKRTMSDGHITESEAKRRRQVANSVYNHPQPDPTTPFNIQQSTSSATDSSTDDHLGVNTAGSSSTGTAEDLTASDLSNRNTLPKNTAAAVEDVEADSWNCLCCTFLNHPSLTECEICHSNRYPEAIEADRWTCLCCTFLNHPTLTDCEICHADRYSQANDEKLTSVNLPPRWCQLGDASSPLVRLDPVDPEYIEVAQEAQKTAKARLQIKMIYRIQNPRLYTLYEVSRSHMADTNGPSVQNERILWHGTSPEVVDKISRNGFNRSFCGKNGCALGRGVYFSSSFDYSVTYATPDRNGNKWIFQCRVLTGRFCRGTSSYLEPPVYDKKTMALYDSAADNVAKPRKFVIFQDANAYPEYAVAFQ